MRFGVSLALTNPRSWPDVARAADSLGYESLWLPEHLVFPVRMASSPIPGDEHPPVPPETPIVDAFAYLSYLAGLTTRIRLGTSVYNLALRHPFVAARAVQTLDMVSGGRALVGVGAGWLRSEWDAAGLDFSTRGRRLDEALEVCRRLWTEDVVEHHGRFFDFEAVMFEPKPVQRPHPPVLVGGLTDAALRRAARHDGWIGMFDTLDTIAPTVARLRQLREEYGLADRPFDVVVGGRVQDVDDVRRWRDAGVTRLMGGQGWDKDPVASLHRFADAMGDELHAWD